jgi:hypothetical protein
VIALGSTPPAIGCAVVEQASLSYAGLPLISVPKVPVYFSAILAIILSFCRHLKDLLFGVSVPAGHV